MVGRSSTRRTRSSSRFSSAGVSVMAAVLMRSMSRTMARCSGASRGWAARVMRWSADLRALSRGSALPVSWACCCARRSADSMSTTKFSSRERDRLCISSSSWVRCRATSLRRVSLTVWRVAVSRATSWASRATVRASMAWAWASAVCRASCSCVWPRRCQSMPLTTRAATATAATTATTVPDTPCGAAGAAAGVAGGLVSTGPDGSMLSGEGAGVMPLILSTPPPEPRRPAWGVTAVPHQSRPPAPRLRCGGGWPRPAPPASAGRAGTAAGAARPARC